MANTQNLTDQELAYTSLKDWSREQKLKLVQQSTSYAKDAHLKIKNTWVEFGALYLNQYKSNNNLLGSKLFFTKFNETMSDFRAESKDIVFLPREDSDKLLIDAFSDVRRFDADQMNWSTTSSQWDSDSAFYGLGVVDLTYFCPKKNTLVPKVLNPFLFIYDPHATCRENLRYAGKIVYMSAYEMMKEFDATEVKKAIKANQLAIKKSINQNAQMAEEVRKYTTGVANTEVDVNNPLSYFEVLDMYINHMGEIHRIVTDSNFSTILHEELVDYEDGDEVIIGKSKKKGSLMPFEFKSLYKVRNSIQGIGVGHIVADDHKADVQITNFLFEGVKQDSVPTMLYKADAMVNPKDLLYRSSGRNVATTESPSTVMTPMPKTDVVNNSTLSFLNLIQNRSDLALGSSRILRGSLTSVQKSATEVAVAKAKQDRLVADRVEDYVLADKSVWKTYVSRKRKYYPKDATMTIRVIGKSGEMELKKLKKKDFMTQEDPDIEVESKLLTEPNRVIQRNELAQSMPYIEKVGGSAGLKQALKQLMRLSDVKESEINTLLAPTPDEMRATIENTEIAQGISPVVAEADNDLEHLAVHQMAEDNEALEKHRIAHMLNHMRKAGENQALEAQKMGLKSNNTQNIPQESTQNAPQTNNLEAMANQILQ